MRDGRHDHVVDAHGPNGLTTWRETKQRGHAKTVDVGVDDSGGEAASGKFGGEVHRHRRFADTTLATCDGDHASESAGTKRVGSLTGTEFRTKLSPLILCHDSEDDRGR